MSSSAAQDAEKQARLFGREIQRLQSVTRTLQQHRKALVQFSQQQRALAAPIRRIPRDVLAMIFQEVNCTTGTLLQFPLRGKPCAIILSQVCHKWRSVAVQAIDLWCIEIKVNIPALRSSAKASKTTYVPPNDRDVYRFEKALPLYLVRSEPHPICFDLVVVEQDLTMFRKIIAAFAAHFRRWHCCRLSMHVMQQIDDEFLRVEESIIPEQLCRVDIISPIAEPIGDVTLFSEAPLLCSWSQCINHLNTIPVLPWTQLTSFTTGPAWTSITNIRSLLRQCRALQELNVSITLPEGGDFPERTPIPLPDLEFLEVKTDNLYVLYYMFWVLTAPSLTTLRLHMGHLDDYRMWLWPHDIFDRFLVRSECVITEFALKSMPIVFFRPSGFYGVIERLSDLEILEINDIEPGPPEDVLAEVAIQRRTATDCKGAGESIVTMI